MTANTTRPPSESNGRSTILELPWHREATTLLELGKPPLMLLVGEPGTGKTTFARRAALDRTGRLPLVLSGSPEATP